MTPTPEAQRPTAAADTAHDTRETAGVRRGRHRKPRPRKVLLAAGGLALAAGVLSLVRIAPDSGVGAPGTAEAEPRLDTGGRSATDRSADTAATVTASPTALPSATSAMGGRSPAPTATGSVSPRAPGTRAAPPAGTAVPATAPAGTPAAPGGPPSPPPTTAPAPHPHPTTPAPQPTPAPSHSTAAPGSDRLCVPVIGLCVGGLGR
ncbi:hypothetical protein AB0N17_33250 [Streptomyces sp. NPDC051133]|uniref:hypothetical protein n=1 Tax=Streptomyces sp. NPDC051133 TaxID=3155521 RepID=UPI0034285D7C